MCCCYYQLFQSNLYFLWIKGLFFSGRIQKRICDLRSYGFFTYQNNGRSEKGSFTKTTACPGAPRDAKKREKKQTDPRGEDKKEKQHKLGMNIRNVDISV